METRIEPRLSKYVKKHHPAEQIIGDKDARPMTRNRLRNESCLLRKFKPKTIFDALQDDDQHKDMEEEIDQIKKNNTWSFVPRLVDKNVISTNWVFRNKLDENGEITRNKARLVCKGYAQEEGLDYGETFSPIARMEGIKTLLAYAAYKGFKVYQMDVNFSFLNGIVEEELYIEQLDGFVDENNKDMVCKLHKALYGLKQAPRAWYERLYKYLVQIGFERTDENSNM